VRPSHELGTYDTNLDLLAHNAPPCDERAFLIHGEYKRLDRLIG
jgi:hypothetical protein